MIVTLLLERSRKKCCASSFIPNFPENIISFFKDEKIIVYCTGVFLNVKCKNRIFQNTTRSFEDKKQVYFIYVLKGLFLVCAIF